MGGRKSSFPITLANWLILPYKPWFAITVKLFRNFSPSIMLYSIFSSCCAKCAFLNGIWANSSNAFAFAADAWRHDVQRSTKYKEWCDWSDVIHWLRKITTWFQLLTIALRCVRVGGNRPLWRNAWFPLSVITHLFRNATQRATHPPQLRQHAAAPTLADFRKNTTRF